MSNPIDSVLLVGFGGPTKPEHIMPFLETVVKGRNIPRERLEEVAHHYHEIGGRSPYNDLTFRQAVALRRRLREAYGVNLPVYGGMRNWHPFMRQTIHAMNHKGCKRAAGIILAAHRGAASDTRYKQDVQTGIAENGGVGPEVVYIGEWFDDPLFYEANAARIEEKTGFQRGAWPDDVPLVFTAHSIPLPAANGTPYVEDILTTCRGVAELLGVRRWHLAWQSKSGDGRVPWLDPDINEVLRDLAASGAREVVVQPIGFLHDHVEVLFDLDVEAKETARELGLKYHRAETVSDHPAFIEMLARRVSAIARGEEPSAPEPALSGAAG